MNARSFALLAALFLGLLTAAARAGDPAGWQLVWQDEFEGHALNAAKWEFEVNAQGGGNNELQYYLTNNARVDGGVLTIEARRERYTGPEGSRSYTSSRLRTRGQGDWKFGRFEVRARLPSGQGLWPAIWMMPTDEVYGGWPNSGEIDIMELLGHKPHQVHGTLHYGDLLQGRHQEGAAYALPTGAFSDNFHVFRFDWEPAVMRWYVDDHLYQTQTRWHTRTHPFPAPFDQRFHLLLNVAVGGNWPGPPNDKTLFPQTLIVDYVRVYRKSD